MKHYKHTVTNQVYAYENEAERQKFGPAQLVEITDQELAALLPAPAVTVPQSVTRFQALAVLHLAGHLPAVEAIMAAPETDMLAKLAWENALYFERSSPTLASLAGAIGLNSQDLDALFTQAAGL